MCAAIKEVESQGREPREGKRERGSELRESGRVRE